jgi:BlaI family transcriptional regulator, penicillinase repressor
VLLFVAMAQQRLSGLEQMVMEYVWGHAGCSAEDCREALAAASRPLKESTVRTVLRRLEAKGYVRHDVEGRTYLYRAAEARQRFAAKAVEQVLDRFFGGSLEQLLVGMVESEVVDRRELQRLARMIAHKKERK